MRLNQPRKLDRSPSPWSHRKEPQGATGYGSAQAPEAGVMVAVVIEDGEPSVAAIPRELDEAAFGGAE